MLSRRAHPVAWLLLLAAVGGGLARLRLRVRRVVGHARSAATGRGDHDAELRRAWVPGTLALFLVSAVAGPRPPARPSSVGRRGRRSALRGLRASVDDLPPPPGDRARPALLAISVYGLVSRRGREHRRRDTDRSRSATDWAGWRSARPPWPRRSCSSCPGSRPRCGPCRRCTSPPRPSSPAAVLVVVLRNRLWGLDLVVSRAVLAGLLTTVLLALYLAATPPDGTAARAMSRPGSSGPASSRWPSSRPAAAGPPGGPAWCTVRPPTRSGWSGGSGHSSSTPVRSRTSSAGSPRTSVASMRLSSVTVHTDETDPVRWGQPAGLPTVVPLRHRGEHVERPGGDRDGRRAAVRRATWHPRRPGLGGGGGGRRRRLRGRRRADARAALQVRLEERRVIRREIHDGLGPSLAGIRPRPPGGAQPAGRPPRGGPGAPGPPAGRGGRRRRGGPHPLHHLLPPVLEELGLEPALRELVHRCRRLPAQRLAGRLPGRRAGPVDGGDGVRHRERGADQRRAARERARPAGSPSGHRRPPGPRGGRQRPRVAPDAVPGVDLRSMRERATEQAAPWTSRRARRAEQQSRRCSRW